MPIGLLFHAKTNGFVCQRIAKASDGVIVALSDKSVLPPIFNGTLIRWDSRKPLAAETTINSAEAVILSRNKRKSREVLTDLCPPTWIKVSEIQYPCVVRPRRHFGGQCFYVCNNKAEALQAIRRCGFRRWYASLLINKQQEYRVFVLNGTPFKVIRRFRDDADATKPWNFHNGGKSIRVKRASWPENVISTAIEAASRVGLQLCAADVIVDADSKAFVLELNTAPGLDRDKTIELFAKKLAAL